MTGIGLLLSAHVICVTLGYGALAASNLWLAILIRQSAGIPAESAVRTSLTIARIFGPLLGVGLLLGFAVMGAMHISALSPWLVGTYAIIALMMLLQGAAGVPWQMRALRIQAGNSGAAALDERTPALIAGAFIVAFSLLVLLMVTRP